jgi:hypothetical protein
LSAEAASGQGTVEDQRQAASIYTSISTYAATGTLAALAGSLALLTYFAGAYHNLAGFFILIGIGVALLCVSIVLGGQGLTQVARDGSKGSWEIAARNQKFNCQAIFALAGILCAILATVAALAFGHANRDLQAQAETTAGGKLSRALKQEVKAVTQLRVQLRTGAQIQGG